MVVGRAGVAAPWWFFFSGAFAGSLGPLVSLVSLTCYSLDSGAPCAIWLLTVPSSGLTSGQLLCWGHLPAPRPGDPLRQCPFCKVRTGP